MLDSDNCKLQVLAIEFKNSNNEKQISKKFTRKDHLKLGSLLIKLHGEGITQVYITE